MDRNMKFGDADVLNLVPLFARHETILMFALFTKVSHELRGELRNRSSREGLSDLTNRNSCP